MTAVEWYHGPTDRDPDPAAMWHLGCGGRIRYVSDAYTCAKCGASEEGQAHHARKEHEAMVVEPIAEGKGSAEERCDECHHVLPAHHETCPGLARSADLEAVDRMVRRTTPAWLGDLAGPPEEANSPTDVGGAHANSASLEDGPDVAALVDELEAEEVAAMPAVIDIEPEDSEEIADEPEPVRPAFGGRPAPKSRNYDWPAIKARYVLGYLEGERTIWPSLDSCAEHFEVVPVRVRERSAAEGWRQQRADHQNELERTAAKSRAKKFTDTAEKLDSGAIQAAEFGVQLVTARLVEIAETRRDAKAQGGDEGYSRIDARELELLARAADMFHRLGMRAVGDPESLKQEITGANGQAVRLEGELQRDDATRIAGVLSVLDKAGFGELVPGLLANQGGGAGEHPALEAGS